MPARFSSQSNELTLKEFISFQNYSIDISTLKQQKIPFCGILRSVIEYIFFYINGLPNQPLKRLLKGQGIIQPYCSGDILLQYVNQEIMDLSLIHISEPTRL